VWTDVDGDDVAFMTSAETVKGKAILQRRSWTHPPLRASALERFRRNV
jgi:hypothetical protein